MINHITEKTKNKIQENFTLMLQAFQTDAICLISKQFGDHYKIEISIDTKEAEIQSLTAEILLDIIELLSQENEEVIFIPNVLKWINDKKYSKTIHASFPSLYIIPIHDTAKNIAAYICMLNKSSKEYTSLEKSLIQVFSENLETTIQTDAFIKQVKSRSNYEIEKKFQLIFDAVPEAISFNELESHKTISVNKAFIEYSGYSEEELMGKSGTELNLWFNEDERLEYRRLFAEQGYVDNFEAKFSNRIGEVFDGLISGKIVNVSGKNYILVIIRSINKLKKAQKELEESEKKFRKVFDSLPDYLSITDIKTREFVEVNDYFIVNSGYDRNQIMGKTALDINMWADVNEQKEHLKLIHKHGGVSNFPMKYKHPEGRIIHGVISSSTIYLNEKPYLLSAIRDIDELMMTKEELRKSEKKFKMFFQSSPDAISINRYSDEEFIEVNDSFLKETLYSRDDLIGKSLFDFDIWVNKEDFQVFVNEINENNEVQNFETKFRKKNGDTIDALVSASISNIEGIPHLITIARNIEDIKQVQKVLEESESRYRTIAEKSHSGIIIINDKYEITYSNPRFTDLFGHTDQESLGKDIRDMIHPDSMNIVLDRYKKRQNNIAVPDFYEFQLITKNKQVRDVEIRSSVYTDINGNIRTISQLSDITETKKALRKNKLLEEKAQNYLDIAAVMMLVLNNKGEVILLNKKACEILEYNEEELINKNWFQNCVPNSVNQEAQESFNTLFSNNPIIEYTEGLIITKSGNERMIAWHNSLLRDDDGHIMGVLSSGEDITEKLSNVRIINRSRAVAILWRNEKNYPVEYVSDNIFKLLGYTAYEFMNQHIKYIDLIHPDDVQTVLNEVVEFSEQDGIEFYKHEYRMITKDNDIIWVEDHTDIQRNSSGEITNYDGVLLDITEKKLADIELLKAKEKAEESDKLKSSFLANMSHEIRTPMNSIIGFSSLLEEDEIEDGEKKVFINRINKNGQLLLGLINDIIDISKIEANQVNFNFEDIDIPSFFESIKEIFSFQAQEKSISLKYQISKNIDSIQFKSDNIRLKQIMINLIANAIKFTPKGGGIIFGSKLIKGCIQFYVKDTGIGIDKKEIPHMFDRFRQADMISNSNYGGTGLGLSISKGLIEKMGGKIWIESKLNKGSSFFFTLPL